MGATYIRNYISMEKVWECGNNLTNKQTHTHTQFQTFICISLRGKVRGMKENLKLIVLVNWRAKERKLNMFM
jgi:hypothetical protein